MGRKSQRKKAKANKKAKVGEIKIHPNQQNDNYFEINAEENSIAQAAELRGTEVTKTSYEKKDDNFYEENLKENEMKMKEKELEIKIHNGKMQQMKQQMEILKEKIKMADEKVKFYDEKINCYRRGSTGVYSAPPPPPNEPMFF